MCLSPDLIENAWTHSSRCVCVADDEWSDGKPRLPGSDPNGECVPRQRILSFFQLVCEKLFISQPPAGVAFLLRASYCDRDGTNRTHQGGLGLGPPANCLDQYLFPFYQRENRSTSKKFLTFFSSYFGDQFLSDCNFMSNICLYSQVK